MSRRKPVPDKRRCEEVLGNGEQCSAWAAHSTFDDERGPRCRLHALSEEERSAAARRAAQKLAVKRRGNSEPAARSNLAPGITLVEVLRVVRPALEARFEHDGSPDWGARCLATFVLVSSFPRYYRDSPEAVRHLLEQALPQRMQSPELLDAERIYREARAEFWKLPAWHPIRGLYARELPRNLVAPWEDYANVVRREAPKDIPPDNAPVRHLPDGRVALEHPGELSLLLESDMSATVGTLDA